MSIDERARHELYARLQDVLGPSEADTIMELLPPVGWADVATKRDLDHLAAVTKRDLEEFRTEFRRNLAHLETQLRAEMTGMRHELRGEFANQTRQLVLTLVPVIVAVNGIAVGLTAYLR